MVSSGRTTWCRRGDAAAAVRDGGPAPRNSWRTFRPPSSTKFHETTLVAEGLLGHMQPEANSLAAVANLAQAAVATREDTRQDTAESQPTGDDASKREAEAAADADPKTS